MIRLLTRWTVVSAAALLAACTVGPNYQRPPAPVPAAYKELGSWKPVTPRKAASGQPWWSIYNDKVLDRLERRIDVSNQTLRADAAAYREAQAIVAEARAGFFPTFNLSGSATRSGGARSTSSRIGGARSAGGGGLAQNSFETLAQASWAPDIWGGIRRTLESDVANAQASAADLAAARLSAQATLAADYFQLRAEDELSRLLSDEAAAFQRSLQIAENRYKVGTAAKTDVETATAQLENTRAQQIATGVQRAAFEHAIAVLTGRAPADFSLASGSLPTAIPITPPGLPSALLERNPTIAASERAMASASARIGVAVAGYFPNVTIGGSYGQQSTLLHTLFTAASSIWSFGLDSVSLPIFNGGLTAAQVAAARAAYDQTVATYRESVLTVLEQVEDQLAASRVLQKEAAVQSRAVAAAREAEQLALNQYRAGTVDYTTVVTAQATALADDEAAVTLRQERLVASVDLIEALGGGWSVGRLPTPGQVESGRSPVIPVSIGVPVKKQ